MNILFVLYGDFRSNSANPLVLYARELESRGHRCAIAVPSNLESMSLHENPAFIPVLYSDVLTSPDSVFPDGHPADVIHACTPREVVRRFITSYMAKRPSPLVIYLEDNELWIATRALGSDDSDMFRFTEEEISDRLPESLSHPFYYGSFIGLADAVAIIQEKLKVTIPPWVHCETVMIGVDVDFFSPRPPDLSLRAKYGVRESEKVIVYHGGMNDFNRPSIEILCRAVGRINLRGSPCRLLRTGRNPLGFLDQMPRETASAISDLGVLPRHELPDLLALADVFVQPGQSDPFEDLRLPGKVPEFLAMGRPVVMPDANISHLFRDGLDVVLLHEGTAEEIAAKCMSLFSDPGRASMIGRAGRLLAEKYFDVRSQACRLEDVYKIACNNFNSAIASEIWQVENGSIPVTLRLARKLRLLARAGGTKSGFGVGEMLLEHARQFEFMQQRLAGLQAGIKERDLQIMSLNQVITERDAQITVLNQAVAERDAQITVLNQAVTERDNQIADLNRSIDGFLISNSWRLTSPLRKTMSFLRRVSTQGIWFTGHDTRSKISIKAFLAIKTERLLIEAQSRLPDTSGPFSKLLGSGEPVVGVMYAWSSSCWNASFQAFLSLGRHFRMSVGKLGLSIYRRLPLPHSSRVAIKAYLFQRGGLILRGLPPYQAWLHSRDLQAPVNGGSCSSSYSMNTLSSIGERPLRNILWIVNQHDFQTQKYRVFNYVEALSGYNIQSKVIRDNEIRGDEGVRFDLVVLNRLAATDASRALVTHCNSFGIPVVYDVDDLVFCPEQISLLRFTSRLPRAEFNLFRDGMALRRELMLRCNVVTTSTFALSQKVRQLGLTALVLPNTIALSDAKQADQLVRGKREDIKTRVRIGYFSGTKTHESDFAHCAHAVGRILAEYTDVELLVVGHLDIPENLHAFHNRVITRPLMSHREMFDELATVDVNLAPLELNNVFTDCKSELKIFEAALLSVPTVASPTSTFTAIIQHGKTGMLAASPDQWYEAIKYLVTDASVRKSMGLRAKQEIARRFLVTTAVGEAKAVYTALINNRISSPPAINEGASTWQIAKPLITVITVLYGKSNEVRYFLESLRRQDFPGPFEVLLVDDLSPDDSVKVVEDFVYQMRFADQAAAKMSIRILRNLTNIGNCASRNWAISEAAGEIVVVIDADCIVNRSYLFEHYRAHQNGHCDVAIGPMNIETRSVDPFSVLGCHEADCQLRELHADLQDPVNPNSFVNCVTRNFSIRKQFVQEHLSGKLFDQRFGYSADPESGFGWEDVEMGCRLYKSGARIRFLQTTVSIHVSHPATTDELTKPLRSLKNFRQLHETHPELVLLARQWSIRTYQAILGWAVTNGVDLTGNPDHAYLDRVFERYLKSPITVRRHRPLRVLTYRWHCSHQVELYRTGHKFTLVTGAGSQLCESWQWDKRPMPANAQFSEVDAIRPTDYDVAILHFDENVLHPEKCAGQVPDDWGATLLWFLNNVPLPKVAVCHGTPQFAGQYTANYQGSDLGVVDESSRKELVELMRDILVVCNSHQAKHEWGFKKATVVWHGFSPHDFPEGRRELGILTMLSTALRNRPHYNGLFVFERVQELLKETMNITNLSVPKPPMSSDSGVQEWSEANFRNYARELARYSVYLNPTLRSPMPRSRGEAMMAGLVTVSMHNHDVDLFIRNGTNGFFAESAEEIGEQLLFLEKNVAAKNKMAAASRCTALDVFNQDRYLSDWGRILEQLVG